MVAEAFGAAERGPRGRAGVAQPQIAALEDELGEHFDRHPDAEILRSLAGLGPVLGARVLGEFGDDPNRYADARGRKAYAGTAPITRASGRSRVVLARVARNRRLADACERWAFCSLTASPGARRYYDALRDPLPGHPPSSPTAGSASSTPAWRVGPPTTRRRRLVGEGTTDSPLDTLRRGMSCPSASAGHRWTVEGVFTALLAWSFFRESFDARIAIGMAAIAGGAAVLSWKPAEWLTLDGSVLLVTGACLAWAIDNNLTRRVSGGDPVQIAALKGIAAGSINVLLAVVQQAALAGLLRDPRRGRRRLPGLRHQPGLVRPRPPSPGLRSDGGVLLDRALRGGARRRPGAP